MKITKSRLKQIIKEEMAKIEEDLALGNLDCAGLRREYEAALARAERSPKRAGKQEWRRVDMFRAKVVECEDAEMAAEAERWYGEEIDGTAPRSGDFPDFEI